MAQSTKANPSELDSMGYRVAELTTATGEAIRLAYVYNPSSFPVKGTILLIHGFPQTSYQFRHVIPLLAQQGYRCVAPDYRGAGGSSKPLDDFRKSTMAADMVLLLDYLGITEPVHVVGHDIGGMIAFSMASRWPDRVRSVNWGECPLPGTSSYRRDVSIRDLAVQQFHFIFHAVLDLPEALIAGRERIYLTHFYCKLAHNLEAFSEADVDHYTAAYEQPGAIRCGLGVYRAFEDDARENQEWVEEHGKCTVPTMLLSGEFSRFRTDTGEMLEEVVGAKDAKTQVVSGSGHYPAEENPANFAEHVLAFAKKH